MLSGAPNWEPFFYARRDSWVSEWCPNTPVGTFSVGPRCRIGKSRLFRAVTGVHPPLIDADGRPA